MVWILCRTGTGALLPQGRLGRDPVVWNPLLRILQNPDDAFHISISPISEIIYSQTLALIISDFIMYVVIWLLSLYMPNAVPLLITFGVQLLISVLWTFLAHQWYFHNFQPGRTAVIYDLHEGMESLVGEYGMEKSSISKRYSV